MKSEKEKVLIIETKKPVDQSQRALMKQINTWNLFQSSKEGNNIKKLCWGYSSSQAFWHTALL